MNTDSLSPAAEHLTGFLLVMITLAALAVLTGLLGCWFARHDAPEPAANVGTPAANDDLVVSAAAVAAIIDGPHRVISVRRETAPSAREQAP